MIEIEVVEIAVTEMDLTSRGQLVDKGAGQCR